MKNRKYLKERVENISEQSVPKKEMLVSQLITNLAGRKILIAVVFVFLCVPICCFRKICNYVGVPVASEETDVQMISLPVTAATNGTSIISIPVGTVKADPFVPYKEVKITTHDVPEMTLVEPPSSSDDDAVRVMDTIVSGILYDKYSPSAIINIAGVDYLVKKGDVVNNYKVLNIMKDTVTVKLGANVYEAGIGEILTSGSISSNTVSNLNKKFGGSRQ